MNIRKIFKRRVIELIWDLPYKEAIKKEYKWDYYNDDLMGGYMFPITLGRVMRALSKYETERLEFGYTCNTIYKYDEVGYITLCDWKLLTDNNRATTDDDQTDETINTLLELIK